MIGDLDRQEPVAGLLGVYCRTAGENLLLATTIAGIASAIRRANPSGNRGTVGGGGKAPAVSLVLALHAAP
jgi:hypothetical protein